ncbi:MAG: HAD family hydrolase, partial [Candidatus Promineifilaceae bacterium]
LRSTITDEWQIADAFDVIVVSAEFGTMKPNPAIYEQCCTLLNLPPEQTVFIDDFQHNIVGANAIGMAGIHYPPSKQVENLIADLAAIGVGEEGK